MNSSENFPVAGLKFSDGRTWEPQLSRERGKPLLSRRQATCITASIVAQQCGLILLILVYCYLCFTLVPIYCHSFCYFYSFALSSPGWTLLCFYHLRSADAGSTTPEGLRHPLQGDCAP